MQTTSIAIQKTEATGKFSNILDKYVVANIARHNFPQFHFIYIYNTLWFTIHIIYMFILRYINLPQITMCTIQ